MFNSIIYEFSFVFGWIFGKMDQMSKNLGKLSGRGRPTPRHGMPRRDVAEWEAGQASGSPR